MYFDKLKDYVMDKYGNCQCALDMEISYHNARMHWKYIYEDILYHDSII